MLPTRVLLAILSVLVFVTGAHSVSSREQWIKVRSKNVQVIGNGSEKEIKQIVANIEQFRDVVSQMFGSAASSSSIPTTVIVFKDDVSYGPFKVNENNAGYFQPGQDTHYISLSAEERGDQHPYKILFHEYTHLLVHTTVGGDSPAWLNEGLAELYSTLLASNHTVVLGQPIRRHITSLQQNPLLPLRTLFQVDYKSRYYNESQKQSIFYAESWALAHYLMMNKGGERRGQLATFLELLRVKMPLEEAFQKAFAISYERMEGDLRAYIQQQRYLSNETVFSNKVTHDWQMDTAPLSQAELQAYLGDLLFHRHRNEAETYLLKALELDPNLTMAHASLGMLRYRQGRIGEALPYLRRAAAADSGNVLVHYYLASALCRPTPTDLKLNLGFSSELAETARAALKKALSLRPDFAPSYNLLAYVNLVTSTDIEQTITLLKEALARSPNKIDYVYMLAQLYAHRDDYKQAKPMLERVIAAEVEPEVRKHAQGLLSTITSIEQQQAQKEATRRARDLSNISNALSSGAASNEPSDPWANLRDALRVPTQGEIRVQGTLSSIECEPSGLMFLVKTNNGVLRLRTDTFQEIKRTTFTADVKGSLTCGARKPENPVVVCYLPLPNNQTKAAGVIKSVEFVPSDFKLVYTTH